MQTRKLGIGLIGAGDIAGSHAQACLELRGECEIRAIADPDPDKARRLADVYAPAALLYADYKEMLTREDIHVVTVCTPPYLREEPIVAALAAGKHAMCEKPFAASLEECDAMLWAANSAGRKLAVMLQTRFELPVRRVRHLVLSGSLGPILYADGYNHHWRGDTYYDKPWRGTWEMERGGVLMNLGVHTLDIMLWTLGEVESVTAMTGTLAHDIETDDVVSAVLKFRCGAIGHFSCTTTFAQSGSGVAFGGKSRMAGYPPRYAAVKEKAGGFPVEDEEALRQLTAEAETIAAATEGFAGPLRDLFAAIREDREPLTGASSVRPTVEVITAIYKAAATGSRVSLPIAEDDPWYTTAGLRRLAVRAGRVPGAGPGAEPVTELRSYSIPDSGSVSGITNTTGENRP